MDITTSYLGLDLKSPLVASSSPLTGDLDGLRRLEDAGAAAVVLPSLFEEQITSEAFEVDHLLNTGAESFGEALSYFPDADFRVGADHYLELVSSAKQALSIPVIGSLNGATAGGWLEHAHLIQEAGADAIELNVYVVAADPELTSEALERGHCELVSAVRRTVDIPVAVKLGPYYTAFAHTARELVACGADGLVLFNRFYQPDVDIEGLEVTANLTLSAPGEFRLPLRWIAILDPLVNASLAASTGIYTASDVIKLLLAGADATMLCAALLRDGAPVVGEILQEVQAWMHEHEYTSVKQLQGSMNQSSCPDPAAFERANYIQALHTYK